MLEIDVKIKALERLLILVELKLSEDVEKGKK